ncbi:MAG: type II secretion system GspH family protein [Ruminococcus sp.]|nr:type II secretion system GspH family protein [Ruminococcus sp.]
MKTTKKGFTLIELIVVIAIIGVLAAILVPTMLGYVKKSKLSSANTSASSIYKAINSALTELDEEGIDIGGTYILTYNATSNTWSDATDEMKNEVDGKFKTKVSNFFADITKVKNGVRAAVVNGSCAAVASASDSTYTGTYPSGIITSDNYDDYSNKLNDALQLAICAAAGTGKDDDGNLKAPTEGAYKEAYEAAAK